jgi:hypothetical protein
VSGILLLILTGLSLWAVVTTLLAIANDGYGPVPTDPTRSP